MTQRQLRSCLGVLLLAIASLGVACKRQPANPRYETVADAPAAPTWSLVDLNGNSISSDSLRGKVVVVDFWATWCAPCLAEIPGYIELQKKLGSDRFVIVGLSLDRRPLNEVKDFVAKHGINYPIAIAGFSEVEAFGNFEAIPTTFVIDREGRLRFRKSGTAHIDELEALVKPLL